jgi:predicted 3-demethylubiquinone-9 3-methyltransferase (glyoxalase superfamily)
MQKIVTNLWFDTQAEEAARFYCSLFKNSRIVNIAHYTDAGPRPAGEVLTVDFELDGQRFTALNGGPEFKFNEAISLLINCADQAEVDYLWDKLTADGGEESMCGWLKDKYGLSWQVVPKGFDEMMSTGNTEGINRAMQAMFSMRKLDLKTLQDAFDGK